MVRLPLEQQIDGIDQRRIDIGRARQHLRDGRGEHALGERGGLRLAAAERDAVAVVARLRRGAAQREIAETGEAHQRFGAAAEGRDDAAQFGEGARDEGGAGRRAEVAPSTAPAASA